MKVERLHAPPPPVVITLSGEEAALLHSALGSALDRAIDPRHTAFAEDMRRLLKDLDS